MHDIDEAIEELYDARTADGNGSELESEKVQFIRQLSAGIKRGIFDLSSMQCGMTVLARIPRMFRLLPNVRCLHFYHNLFRDGGLQNILQIMSSNPQIVMLDIGTNDLTDGSLICLVDILKRTNIKSLQLGRRTPSLQENRFSEDGLVTIVNAIIETGKLECFGICGIPLVKQSKSSKAKGFTAQVAKMLAQCASLQNLDFSYCGFSDNDQKELTDGFSKNKHLKYLNLSNNQFRYGSDIIDGLCTLDHLRSLNLESCCLKGDAVEKIAARFQSGWGLIRLILSDNPVGTSAAALLFRSLCYNDTLTVLYMSKTYIDFGVADDLKDYLKETQVLRELDLSGNNLGNEISNVFAEVLEHQQTLVKINLKSTRITNEGGLAICRSLRLNRTLRCLILKDNFLVREIGSQLGELLKANSSLKMIDLSSNQLDYFALDEIEKIMVRNRNARHNQQLQDLKTECLKLSIKNAQLPLRMDALNELTKRDVVLSGEVSKLVKQSEAYDRETADSLESLVKACEDIDKSIEDKRRQLHDIDVTIAELESDNAVALKDLQTKTDEEEKILANMVQQEKDIQKEITAMQTAAHDAEQQLKNEITMLEEMVKEIEAATKDKENLLNYQLPPFPYSDGISTMLP